MYHNVAKRPQQINNPTYSSHGRQKNHNYKKKKKKKKKKNQKKKNPKPSNTLSCHFLHFCLERITSISIQTAFILKKGTRKT